MRRAPVIAFLFAIAGLIPAASQAQTETVTYYHTDAIGSVRMTTDAAGHVLGRYDYQPFGLRLDQTPAPPPERRQFAGKERDTETGFDYFGGRFYFGLHGRFTTVDPVLDIDQALVDPQRWNRYTYVRNNPFRYVDPDGRAIETLWDVGSLGMSLHAVWQNPTSIWNWVSVGTDLVSVVGPGIPAIGMAIRGIGNADTMVDAVRAAREASGVSRGAHRAYEVALSGGEHFGTIRNMIGRSPGEILNAIKSHEATVAEHVQKLADPAKYAKGWDRMTERERGGLVNKWQKDSRRNQDLADVMRGLYDDLMRGYGQVP